jgi:transcriptional regulator with XRE-family HTH domain
MERKQFRARRGRVVGQRIGPALRDLRRREGKTLDEVALSCDVSRRYLSNIENGKTEVSWTLLLVLADALGVDPTYFFAYQQASTQIEQDLTALLRQIAIPAELVPRLLTLSVEAQGALLDGLR